MAETLFDPVARMLRRRRASRRTERPFLAERIVGEWEERLVPIARRFRTGFACGVPAGLRDRVANLALNMRFADTIDALAEVEEATLDLLCVMGELDVRDELPVLLRILASRVAPGGLLLGALPGGQSLPALRAALHVAAAASGRFEARFHPRIEPGALAGLLHDAGLADAVVDVDRVKLRYRSLNQLLQDLRDHAATNQLAARPRAGLARASLEAARRAFADGAEKGATSETVDLLHFAAWAPPANNRP